MKAPTMVALVMGIASLQACTLEAEAELGKQQQSEIIEIHGGCPPGTIGNGEICVDPLEGGGDGGGGGPTGAEGGPGGGGDGGGGGGSPPAPRPPEREDCSQFHTTKECTSCCERNFWNVDTKKCKGKRESTCWKNAMDVYAGCIARCPPEPCQCTTCPCIPA